MGRGNPDERAILHAIGLPSAGLLLCVCGWFAVRALDALESRIAGVERLARSNETEILKLQYLCARHAVGP